MIESESHDLNEAGVRKFRKKLEKVFICSLVHSKLLDDTSLPLFDHPKSLGNFDIVNKVNRRLVAFHFSLVSYIRQFPIYYSTMPVRINGKAQSQNLIDSGNFITSCISKRPSQCFDVEFLDQPGPFKKVDGTYIPSCDCCFEAFKCHLQRISMIK